MEMVTVYKKWMDELQEKQFHDSGELAYVHGTIKALAGMDDHPEFVMEQLKKMAQKIERGVDISQD